MSLHSAIPTLAPHLVLVGGGHSHVTVLREWGMARHRPTGARMTLVTPDLQAPYSGMVPGLIAGHYRFEEAHIPLEPLAARASAALIHDRVIGLDLKAKRLICQSSPPIAFDWLSLNTGSTPALDGVPGAREWSVPIKPIEGFLKRWESVLSGLRRNPPAVFRVLVAGGGAGGVEVMLALEHRLRAELGLTLPSDLKLECHLFCASERMLPEHPLRVREKFERIFRERGLVCHTGERIVALKEGRVQCASGREAEGDFIVWVTGASAPAWLRESGLATDERGFVQLNACLQSVTSPWVFAAGDVASVVPYPRPKAGVFAVRQGKPLFENLVRAMTGRELVPFVPQRHFLTLISTGGRHAVGSRGGWAVEGNWVWRWKDYIDRKFMRRFSVATRVS